MAAPKKISLLGCADCPSTKKVKIVASFLGVELVTPAVKVEDVCKDEVFLKKKSPESLPVLEVPGVGFIFQANAINKYLAETNDNKLYAADVYRRSQIDQWVSYAASTIEPAQRAWLAPILWSAPHSEVVDVWAQGQIEKVFKSLNLWLETRSYLANERFSLADISVAVALGPLYQNTLEPKFRNKFPNVNRWFECATSKPQFASVYNVDIAAWCVVARTAKKTAAPKPKKAAADADEEAETPKEDAPKEAPKEDAHGEDAEDVEAQIAADEKAKSKNALDALPKSPFVIDDFKRFYSNNPIDVSMEYLWKNFDNDGWTLWFAKYKHSADLTKLFMSGNLVGGYYQRLDRLRKYCFGCTSVFGVDDNNRIEGCWIVRSKSIPDSFREVDDTELYTWTPVDIAKTEDKDLVKKFFNAEDLDQPCAEWKCFK